MQRELTRRGLYQDKIDGKAGMLTRAALGAYQKANGLKLDCWPAQSVLDQCRSGRGTLKPDRAQRKPARIVRTGVSSTAADSRTAIVFSSRGQPRAART